jgi:hypothetical protein
MALTPAEAQELAQLEKEVGQHAPAQSSGGLSPQEQLEMQSLEKEVGHLAPAQTNVPQTILEHGANGAALGYLPQLQAAAQPAVFGILNALHGNKEDDATNFVRGDSYVNARDANIKRMADEKAANPKTAMASEIGGGLVGALATPMGGPATGLANGLLKGAGIGAAYGGLSNPGDQEGVEDQWQLGDRGRNAVKGAVIGGATGGAASGVSKLLKGAAQGTKDIAETQAVRAGGAMLKDFRALEGRDQVGPTGRYMLDNGLVRMGDTVDSIAEKARARNQTAGKALGDIYKSADSAMANPDVGIQVGNSPGFNPVQDKEAILQAVNERLGNSEGKAGAIKRVSDYLDQLALDHGDKTLPPSVANDVKTSLDNVINYERNPLKGSPVAEEAFKTGRGILGGKIGDQVGALSGEDAAKALKDQNLDFGMSKKVGNMAGDYASRDKSHRMFGLTDMIAGAAGSAAGAGAGLVMGDHDPAHEGGMGVGGMALGMLANKLGRNYGPAILSRSADIASKVLAPADVALQPIGNALASEAALRALIQKENLNRELKKKTGSSKEPEIKMAQ